MNLLQIQTFIEVAETKSFSKAGLRLSVPRSTVSARIHALEERLNCRLFHRTTRKVALTDEGVRYLQHCQEAMVKLINVEMELGDPAELSGKIRISAPIDISKKYLANLLSKFTESNPSVEIEIIITDEPLNLVEHNIDFSLRGQAPGSSGLIARQLGEGKMRLYASKAYVAKNLKGRKAKDLSEHVIFDPTGKGAKALPRGSGTKQIHTRNFELTKALCMQSKGIAFLPQEICKEEEARGDLVPLDFDKDLPPLKLYLVMPSRRLVPPRVRAFIDFLVSENKKAVVL